MRTDLQERYRASDGISLGDITGQTTFTIAGPAGQTGASCTGATCTATLAGSYTVTGTDNGITATAAITVAPTAIASLTPTAGDVQSAAEGAEFATPLAVTAVDTYGNPVPGAAVTFTVTSGSASFAGAQSTTATTGSDGVATAPIALKAGTSAGAVSVTATVAGSSQTTQFDETVTGTGPARSDLAVTITAPCTVSAVAPRRSRSPYRTRALRPPRMCSPPSSWHPSC